MLDLGNFIGLEKKLLALFDRTCGQKHVNILRNIDFRIRLRQVM